jgi:predicted metal-dependent HD superfamily phosphohydrolase
MNWPAQDRWQRLWQAAGASGDSATWYQRLTQAYAEPQRHYHNQQHIAECLAEFDAARHLAQQPVAVEMALWFHDAVYDPKAGDNEERSAALAKVCLEAAGLSDFAGTTAELVMATKLHGADAGPDAALVVDVDLSILGQSEVRFAEYETQIRKEYGWVPKLIFNPKRAEILQRFLDRERIYTNEHFATRYEQNARRNLEESIRKLKRLWG